MNEQVEIAIGGYEDCHAVNKQNGGDETSGDGLATGNRKPRSEGEVKKYKKIGRFYNVTLRQAIYGYFITYTKYRSKKDRDEARKFYLECKHFEKHGAKENTARMRSWEGIGSPPISFYPKMPFWKIYFYSNPFRVRIK